jgi:uncharacterized protein YjiS (DUF1127 family)
MSCTDTTLVHQPSRPAAVLRQVVAPVWAWLRRAVAAGMEVRITRRHERILMALPDRQLRDLGFEREDIRRALRQRGY